MSDTLDIRRLLNTPFRDLARGRVNGRLDVRRHIAAAGLPTAASELIHRVVRRTRLWRIEKVAVADELIAHFADGVMSGASVDDLIRDFGDERAAAKLVRRAKKRGRSWPWHVAKYVAWIALVIFAIDAILLARFIFGRATVTVDYLAQLNAPIVVIPSADRAWPLYRQAILGFGMGKDRDTAIEKPLAGDAHRSMQQARPGDPEWPALVAWLDAHNPAFDHLRHAAAKPALGFVLGPDGPAYDPELGFNAKHYRFRGEGVEPSPLDESIVSVLLTGLNPMRQMAGLLSADLTHAREQGDGARVIADLEAMIGMSRQLRDAEAVIVTRLVSIGIGRIALDDLRETLAQTPQLLSDADLVRLAHRISSAMGGETASAFYDLSGERFSFKDVLQRLYTSDGNGDGRLAFSAVQALRDFGQLGGDEMARPPQPNTAADMAKLVVIGSYVATLDARRATDEEYGRLFDLAASDLARPLYAIDPKQSGERQVQKRIDEIGRSAVERVRLVLVPIFMPSFSKSQETAERYIGTRDGVLIAIALELHRRRHGGAYPATLDELVPTLLPSMPRDRISGAAIRYRLVNGAPVVYSVGVDRDDDGGRDDAGKADSTGHHDRLARWSLESDESIESVDGDWILFDARPTAATTR